MDLGEIKGLKDITLKEINRRWLAGDEYLWTGARRGGRWYRSSARKQIDISPAGFRLFKTAFGCSYDMDPSTTRLKLSRTAEGGLVPYRNIFRGMKEQKSQTGAMGYLRGVTLSVLPLPPPPLSCLRFPLSPLARRRRGALHDNPLPLSEQEDTSCRTVHKLLCCDVYAFLWKI